MGLGMPDWLTSSPAGDESDDFPTAAPLDRPSSPHVLASEAIPPPPTCAQARTVLEGMKVVCICKGIRKSVFWKVLDKGTRTKEEVNCLTGAGSGGCQGRRCGPRIMEMLRDFFGAS
jgi:bacterioferritin-associated ferredoxin